MEPVDTQKILIVDDIPSNIQVLNETLRGEYRIFFATSGRDALKLAAEVQPDLILLDVMMPEMDGREVCRWLKAEPLLRDIPVVFVTAMAQEDDEATGLELGAVDYITKPFNPALVRLRVRNHLELKRQRDLLARLSSLDGLTGVANRRAFDDTLDREWRRAARAGSELALIMIDIDHFKAYNDRYGHLAGDDCLRRVARTLAATSVRPADFLARFGGEEFACVLPETDAAGARFLAEKMRRAVGELAVPHVASPSAHHVSISLGVATARPSPGDLPKTLLEKADSMLYLAKDLGRNRVQAVVTVNELRGMGEGGGAPLSPVGC